MYTYHFGKYVLSYADISFFYCFLMKQVELNYLNDWDSYFTMQISETLLCSILIILMLLYVELASTR